MKRRSIAVVLAALVLAPPLVAARGGGKPAGSDSYQIGERLPERAGKGKDAADARYRVLKWDELISPDWNPLAIIKSLNLETMLDSDPRAIAALERLKQEWDRAPGNAALDGAEVRLAGFVVPLERQGNALREFLLVPYFGACIHVPPPPANQVVHVVAARPVPDAATMDAVWVSGRLSLSAVQTQMGNSAYRLAAARVEPYKDRR